MNEEFADDEKLYRAVYPPSVRAMFWKDDGSISSAAFSDPKGLSVERGDYRSDREVIAVMKKYFTGSIISVNVGQCKAVNAIVKYLPTRRSIYHSEIHGANDTKLLTKRQRRQLAQSAVIEYND